ncbi:MAG: GH3 auxin-responsive promoter family protein [Thermoanaerobaculia bacterium]|nr:GH3 auxin-responsive promoter family protein [Thermoanaerobaculia bacterium]
MIARLAHRAWVRLNLGQERRFRRALADPGRAQKELLRHYLRRNADTLVGIRYRFGRIDSEESYRRRVPIRTYDEMVTDVELIAAGQPNVWTREKVVRLQPSSGSTTARKLVPFTRRSQREFQRAVGPWIVDLYRRRPRALSGRAYWAISPKASSRLDPSRGGPIPIGFDDDAAYLGGVAARLVDRVLAVPSCVSHIEDLDEFRQTTLRYLLATPDLGLVSVWHPSFFTLLLDALPSHWDSLLECLPRGRAAELHAVGPHDVRAIWPRLDVVSCWRDAHAAHPARELERRLRGVAIEGKGLLATEAVVTIPYAERHPLAVRSHFFEFLDEKDRAHGAAELRDGATYRVVVTTGGGLYRYRLGDRVRVRGFLGRTPCLEFLGRDDRVSDRCGEKLSDGFVAQVLRRLLEKHSADVRFAMLAPEESTAEAPRYRLFLELDERSTAPLANDLTTQLDESLSENPHYRLARSLGQLAPADVLRVEVGAHQRYLESKRRAGQRLGDIKPTCLDTDSGWTERMMAPTE